MLLSVLRWISVRSSVLRSRVGLECARHNVCNLLIPPEETRAFCSLGNTGLCRCAPVQSDENGHGAVPTGEQIPHWFFQSRSGFLGGGFPCGVICGFAVGQPIT